MENCAICGNKLGLLKNKSLTGELYCCACHRKLVKVEGFGVVSKNMTIEDIANKINGTYVEPEDLSKSTENEGSSNPHSESLPPVTSGQCAVCGCALGSLKTTLKSGEFMCTDCMLTLQKVKGSNTVVENHLAAEVREITSIKFKDPLKTILYERTDSGSHPVLGIVLMVIGLALSLSVVGAIIGGPLFIVGIIMIFRKTVSTIKRLKGPCPWCQTQISADTTAKGVTCKACKKRLVVRNESFIKVE